MKPPCRVDAVGHRGHAKFAHAVVDIVARRIVFNRCRARPDGQVTRRKIRRTAQQFREMRAVGVQRVLRGLAAGDFRRLEPAVSPRSRGRSRQSLPAGCHPCSESAQRPAPETAAGRRRISRSGRARLFAARTCIPALIDLFRDLEGRIFPAPAAGGPGPPLFRPAPRRETLPTPLCWANQKPMMVRQIISDGLSFTACASAMACLMACGS